MEGDSNTSNSTRGGDICRCQSPRSLAWENLREGGEKEKVHLLAKYLQSLALHWAEERRLIKSFAWVGERGHSSPEAQAAALWRKKRGGVDRQLFPEKTEGNIVGVSLRSPTSNGGIWKGERERRGKTRSSRPLPNRGIPTYRNDDDDFRKKGGEKGEEDNVYLQKRAQRPCFIYHC